MTAVLITRPRDTSENLARALQKLGYETVIEPLFSITPTYQPRPAENNYAAVLITSGNALAMLSTIDISDLYDLPCFCVGAATAEKARIFGFRKVQNSAGDGSDLARYVMQILKTPQPLLHIAGRHPDSKAQIELEKSGYAVVAWPVYDTVPATSLTSETIELLKNGKLDAVTLFSPRTAEGLSNLLRTAGLETCCKSLTAICLSSAVAEAISGLPWKRLAAAPKPTEDDVIDCLQKFCPVKA